MFKCYWVTNVLIESLQGKYCFGLFLMSKRKWVLTTAIEKYTDNYFFDIESDRKILQQTRH